MNLIVGRAFGIVTTVAPAGKPLRRFGVPTRGPFDRESFALANGLLGNDLDAPALELLGGTLSLRAEEAMWIACVGAVGDNAAFLVQAGEQISVSVSAAGNALYIATAPAGQIKRPIKLAEPLESLAHGAIRYFASADGEEIALPTLKVNPASNRAGIRLDGFAPIPTEERPSEPCCVGTIQLTPSGQLIVVGPDGPTIGGYIRIGYVVDADLDKLAHLRPGQDVILQKLVWNNVISASQRYTKEVTRRRQELRAALISIRSRS